MSEHSSDALADAVKEIQTYADFVNFLQLFLRNYREHPEDWEENDTLERFLDAMGRFVSSLHGYYANFKIDVDLNNPGWRVFADILLASRVYE